MNSIVNIEDRLHIIKQLFELQIKVGAQFDYILLSTEHLKWEQNDFRAESIGANLNDLKQLKILKNIRSLSDEIMNLYLKLPKNVPYLKRTIIYDFEGIPFGAKFRDFLLTKKEDGKRYNYLTKENTVSVLKNDDWVGTWSLMHEDHWKSCSYFEIHQESKEFNFLFHNSQFFDFARNTYLFLVDSVFIGNLQPDQKTFADYLKSENKEVLIKKIESLVNEKKGKRIAHVLIYLQEKGLINMPDNRKDIYNSMRKEFSFETTDQSIDSFLCKYDNFRKYNEIEFKFVEDGFK